jgi:hypothetical protein
MRWGRVAAVVGVALAAAAPWWGPPVLRPMRFFGVRRVEVVGTRYLAPAGVAQALGLRPEASVFDDLGELEARVRAMGGVEAVEVGRRLPSTLRVTVREVEPVALADGPAGLVPLGADARPLPFDVTSAPVDAPVVARAERALLAALETVRRADAGFFADVAAARTRGAEVELVVNEGRVRMAMPVDPQVVRRVAAVQRDLASRGLAWRELDGRYGTWVVVRKARVPAAAGGTA